MCFFQALLFVYSVTVVCISDKYFAGLAFLIAAFPTSASSTLCCLKVKNRFVNENGVLDFI